MVARHERECRQQGLGHGRFGQLGQQHEQGAPPEASKRLREGGAVVALHQPRLQGVHGLGHAAQLAARVAGADDGAHLLVEGDEAGAVAEAGRNRRQHHHRVHGVVETRHLGHLARHRPPRVQQQQHGLVSFGPVGADDDLRGSGRRRPVDAAALVVDPVLAQGLELRAAALAARRPEADLQDPRPVDAELGLLAGLERRVHPQQAPQLTATLTGRQPEGTLDAQHQLGRCEAASTGRA